jgi:prevent-host-death family protein
MPASVGVRELRQNLSRYLDQVKEGESFVVTERGREVARLTPSGPPDSAIARLVAERGRPRRAPRDTAIARRLAYLDTSALVKLPLEEDGHEALRRELLAWDGFVSSALLSVEAVRACARYGPAFAHAATQALEAVALVPLDDAVLERAAGLAPGELRTRDALHLATALSLADEIGVVLTYDGHLAAAARKAGLAVRSPA